MKKIILIIAKYLFYLYAFIWLIFPRNVSSMKDVLKIFYIDFLKINTKDIEIVNISENELIIRCRNPCPILWLATHLKLDTKYVCKEVSEPVCKYFLKKLNQKLIFERNYNYIRPYKDGCEERIHIKKNKNNN
ncbi:MAG: hypothetical protein QXI49_06585 [Candidatus Methanomethylicaceae archaeon]